MVSVIKPPQIFPDREKGRPWVFLAGSIDLGLAENWQEKLEGYFADQSLVLLNPRREDWDSTWQQSIEHLNFRHQVEWELKGLEMADLILMYFAPESLAPVTLLELGLQARSQKLLICSPPGYWRRGNLEVVCNWYQIPLFSDWQDWLEAANQILFEI